MSDDNGKKPKPDDKDQNPIFAAFQNLNLNANYNNYREEGESRNINCNNNNPNLNVYNYNVGYMSNASFIPPPPRMTQPGVAPSSRNSGQPFPFPLIFVSPGIDINDNNLPLKLWDMMTCKERYHDFKTFLKDCDTYPMAKERLERCLVSIVSKLSQNRFTFLNFATTHNGSKVLETLLRRNPSLDQVIFGSVFLNFRQLMDDKNGVRLINPTIRAVDKPKKEMLYELLYIHTLELAKLENGCTAVNNVFEETRGKYRNLILDLVAQNSVWLSFDPYGTYVVQNFLTLHNPDAIEAIAKKLHGNFFRLAMKKEGSWVVEKCLNSSHFVRDKVLEEFSGNQKEWVRMAKDQYGNFVAQCALRVMKQKGKITLLRWFLEKLRPHFGVMKFGYGNKTLQMIHNEGWIDQSPHNL